MWWFLFVAVVVIGALALDHSGVFGGRSRPITLGRIAGVGLILLGVALIVAS
jgi:uncharacterized membrane protein YdcZ (DUF606 family)